MPVCKPMRTRTDESDGHSAASRARCAAAAASTASAGDSNTEKDSSARHSTSRPPRAAKARRSSARDSARTLQYSGAQPADERGRPLDVGEEEGEFLLGHGFEGSTIGGAPNRRPPPERGTASRTIGSQSVSCRSILAWFF